MSRALMSTNKAPYSSTSNLAIRSPLAVHLEDSSRKDKQVYRSDGDQSIPPSPTSSDPSNRDQATVAINALDHGRRQRVPTVEQAQSTSIDEMPQKEILGYHHQQDSRFNQNSRQYGSSGSQDEKSQYGDPIVLPRPYAIRPTPSPQSAQSSLSHSSSHFSTSPSKSRRLHFFKSSSVSSMPTKPQDRSDGRSDLDIEKISAYTRSDQPQPQLLTGHSMMLPSLPDFEVEAFCPSCQKWVMTRIRYRSGAGVWLFSFVLLILTIVFFWIPFYVKYFKDVVHFCPSCGHKIGRFRKI